MICHAEMEVGNSIDVEISMAEQVDSDDDDDIFGDLGIPNIAQLLIPESSSASIAPTQTDGGMDATIFYIVFECCETLVPASHLTINLYCVSVYISSTHMTFCLRHASAANSITRVCLKSPRDE